MNKELEALEALASLKTSYDFLVAMDKKFKDERTEKDLSVIQEYIHESKQNENKAKAFDLIKENIFFEFQIIDGKETLVVEKLFFVKLPEEKRDFLKEMLK